MRNLEEYPITNDEIIACLDTLIAEHSYPNKLSVGDMTPILLAKAKEIIKKVIVRELESKCLQLWLLRGDVAPECCDCEWVQGNLLCERHKMENI